MSGPYYWIEAQSSLKVPREKRAKLLDAINKATNQKYDTLDDAFNRSGFSIENENERITERNPSYGDLIDISPTQSYWCLETKILKIAAPFIEGTFSMIYHSYGWNLLPLKRIVIENGEYKEYEGEVIWNENKGENK